VAYVVHVSTGMIGLVTGTVALFARKGGNLHRSAGTIFICSMVIMAVFAGYLAVAVPEQLINLFIAFLTLYLLATAWMTVRRRACTAGLLEKIALAVSLCLCVPFAILSFQLAAGWKPLFKSAVPYKGPVLVAIYTFTAVLAAAAFGDDKVVFSEGISGALHELAPGQRHRAT
jgi:uncharacterized membrane protein